MFLAPDKGLWVASSTTISNSSTSNSDDLSITWRYAFSPACFIIFITNLNEVLNVMLIKYVSYNNEYLKIKILDVIGGTNSQIRNMAFSRIKNK